MIVVLTKQIYGSRSYLYFCFFGEDKIYETMHTLSPIVTFAQPSASLEDKQLTPSDGSTASYAHC